jgi:dihydroxyacetone kinase-like protein
MEKTVTGISLATSDMARILRQVASDLKEHDEELRQLDAAIGDGDLGITVNLFARAMSEYLENTKESDMGILLSQCGLYVNKANPSTFGTILATAFMGMGKMVKGKTRIEFSDLVPMGEGAVEAIQKRGKAQVGDKTVLDSLIPAVEALKQAIENNAEPKLAIAAAIKAAEQGMKATANMKAKVGRAKMFQDSSIGIQDGGATAIYYMIESFARGLTT